MKKSICIFLALLYLSIGNYKAQSLTCNSEDKFYKKWKESKLYVVKTTDKEINNRLEKAVKDIFPNYAATVSEAEANKLMDTETNFFVTVYYPGQYKVKQNVWDKYNFGIGIFMGRAKNLQKIDFYKDYLVRYDYLPVAPNMNLSLVIPAAREAYTKNGLDKTFEPEGTIATMIPSTIMGFKQLLDVTDKAGGMSVLKILKEAGKVYAAEAPMLKNKTLLVLDHEITQPFYDAYAFKKEKIQVNDLSKLEAKDKNYCFLIYRIEYETSTAQVTVIDCETSKIIYQYSALTATKGDKMKKTYADNLNSAIKGKVVD